MLQRGLLASHQTGWTPCLPNYFWFFGLGLPCIGAFQDSDLPVVWAGTVIPCIREPYVKPPRPEPYTLCIPYHLPCKP